MPELPEVETIKEAMKKALEGSVIESAKVFNRKLRSVIPFDFEQKAEGASIKRIYRIAKYVVMELDNDYSIIWHFGMSGRIKIIDKTPEFLEKHDHVLIKTNKCVIIYNDVRRFGLLVYEDTAKISTNPLFKNLGCDPFDERLTADLLMQKLSKKNTPIKILLLDQSIINGIGNIYASESLYEAGISPLRTGSSLTKEECRKLLTAVRDVLKKAIQAGGSTLHDYRKPDGSTGYFQYQHCVYNKAGERCPNCCCNFRESGGIKKLVQGGRSTYYCEYLQK